jgi:peptidoglycan/xylan/chitin deacetylase (PgdA/CDA1 family)
MTFILTSRERVKLQSGHCLFTFDDGPAGIVTDELLAVLRGFNVKACFCVIGSLVATRPEQIRAMVDEGHFLVNHTFHHRFGDLWDVNRLQSDLVLCDRAVSNAIGIANHPLAWFRPPFGLVTRSVREVAKKRRILPITHFGFDTLFNSDRPVGPRRWIVEDARRFEGGIYLLHDGLFNSRFSSIIRPSSDRSWVPRAMRRILEDLSECGFKFPEPSKTLDSLAV